MEKNSLRRKIAAAGLVVLGGLSLTGCGKSAVDYEGTGNEFSVRGVVSDAEGDGLVQIQEDQIVVIGASGKAETWFSEGKGQGVLSDEFDFLQKYSKEPGGMLSCGDNTYVGEVSDQYGHLIEPEALQPGTVVEIHGKIRQSMYYQSTGKSGYCNEEDLAVYDRVTIVDRPLR